MKKYPPILCFFPLIISCSGKPTPQFENGWHKAYVEISTRDAEAAMVLTTDGTIDSICFSSGKCVGHFTQWTTFENSQNVSGKDNDDIYTVYIIPDEWDQTKELFKKKDEQPDYN